MKFLGKVVRGQALGAKLGFPTANLEVEEAEDLPRGVHKARVSGAAEKSLAGALNVGTRPTLGGIELVVEVHIPGFKGDLYGKLLEIEILSKIRDEIKFATLDELKAQIAKDVAALRQP